MLKPDHQTNTGFLRYVLSSYEYKGKCLKILFSKYAMLRFVIYYVLACLHIKGFFFIIMYKFILHFFNLYCVEAKYGNKIGQLMHLRYWVQEVGFFLCTVSCIVKFWNI